VAGALIATGALVLTDDSGGGSSSSPRAARQAQAAGAAPSAQGDISAILAEDAPAVVAITTDGGPLVDAQGRFVGINTAIANPDTAQNVGFVIPISQAKPIIDRLRGGA
jgi:S1-C subfamily serine protease